MTLFEHIRDGLIVSAQAEGDSPFNTPKAVADFAITAQMGGAVAIRTEGFEKTRAIKQAVQVPVIGLIKSYFPDGTVRITGSWADVEALLATGCDMLAVDATFRLREGLTGPQFIAEIKRRHAVPVMADCATLAEARAAAEAGADCVSTTLHGYTPDTAHELDHSPNYRLLRQLVRELGPQVPVVAEGRFNTPNDARNAIGMGAWAVVVGTAITRPQVITKWFADAINSLK